MCFILKTARGHVFCFYRVGVRVFGAQTENRTLFLAKASWYQSWHLPGIRFLWPLLPRVLARFHTSLREDAAVIISAHVRMSALLFSSVNWIHVESYTLKWYFFHYIVSDEVIVWLLNGNARKFLRKHRYTSTLDSRNICVFMSRSL